MAWIEETVTSVEELASNLLTISMSPILYRGQSRTEWKHIKTRFTRAIEQRQKVEPHVSADSPRLDITTPMLEAASIARFTKHGHMHLNTTEIRLLSTVVGTLSLMQHYGAPTRLLDWTYSPWVAAYFAAIDDLDHDGAIWLFDFNALIAPEAKDNEIKAHLNRMNQATNTHSWVEATSASHDVVSVIHTVVDNGRMTAQQSAHTMAATLEKPHDVIIEEMIEKDRRKKIIVTSSMKAKLVRHLERMNINQSSLFGGLEGVGRTIRDDIQWGGDISINAELAEMIHARSNSTFS